MVLRLSPGSLFGTALAFAGAGLGVILTKGQTTWVPQNHWLAPALFSIAGILVVGSVWLIRRSRAKISSGADKIEQTVIRPQTRGLASPALAAGRDIHVTYGRPTSERPVHSRVPENLKPSAQATSPNLQYVTSKEKRVFVSPLARDGVCDPRNSEEHGKSIQALVLKFENKVLSDRKIGRALNVIAKIRLKSKDGVAERVIDYGVWLNSPCNSTDMGIGDTRELVLMCAMDDGSLVAFEDRREANHQFYDNFSYIDDACVDGLEMVEITLIDKNTQATLNHKLRIWCEGARFCVQQL